MFKKVIVALALTGCTSRTMVPFNITSTPPGAQVDVNGVSFGLTPTVVKMECDRGWALASPSYLVIVSPTVYTLGYSQNKIVNPCLLLQQGYGDLNFDMNLMNAPMQNDLNLNISSK